MELKLSENIRSNRKDRGLTQEQLSEVLGVTVGAVYKWEAGLSVPELPMIVEMADFFDTSVDSLLGYSMKDNRIAATAKRLHVYKDTLDPEGISEAEKALKKYPHDFDIVHESANLYISIGAWKRDPKLISRGRELLLSSIPLLSSKQDGTINDTVLYGELADSYYFQGKWKECVEIWKEHNAGGIYNADIGYELTCHEDPQGDASGYLSYGLILTLNPIIKSMIGLAMEHIFHGELTEGGVLIQNCIDFLMFFKKDDTPNYLDRIVSASMVSLAFVHFLKKEKEQVEKILFDAYTLASKFDENPDYDTGNLRFIRINEICKAYDSFGETAVDAVEGTVRHWRDPEFMKVWKSLRKKWENKTK